METYSLIDKNGLVSIREMTTGLIVKKFPKKDKMQLKRARLLTLGLNRGQAFEGFTPPFFAERNND